MFPLELVNTAFKSRGSVPNPVPLIIITPFITGDQETGDMAVISTVLAIGPYVNGMLAVKFLYVA